MVPGRPSLWFRRVLLIAAALAASLILAAPASAYSILAHEGTVDALWDSDIVPVLRTKYPGLSDAQLVEARAYAYGGSLIQDLGYYPFGSHLFTNLTHYVRTGDFVQALLRDASNADELAFALGALAHYASDIAGHPIAVNRAVPIMYPKVRAAVGDRALYIDSPARHVMVEFAYDVLQVARGGYAAQAYRDRIGFQVAKPLLERAVRETYAIDLGDMLLNVDLAIGTYRHAVSTTIPELTRIAWRDKRKEIEQRTPDVTEQSFVYSLSRQDYERDFGDKYRKPGTFSRFLAFLLKIVPKVGPFKPLSFEPLNTEAERLFDESVTTARTRYQVLLRQVRAGALSLADTDFDTGHRPIFGDNALADETNADLLHELAKRKFDGMPAELAKHLQDFFAGQLQASKQLKKKDLARVRSELAALGRQRAAAGR